MRHENPHTPSSRRIYPTRNGDHTKSTKRFPGRPKGHKGTTRPKPKLIDLVKAPEHKSACTHCGTPLNEPTHVEHHIFEEIANPKPQQIIDFLESQYTCNTCNAYNYARHPDCPPDGVFGKNVLVQTTLLKFEDRLPLKKIVEALKRDYTLTITPASVLDITRRVSEYLNPQYEAVKRKIQKARVVYVDETGVKVDGVRYWLWIFTTLTETVVVIRKSRGKNVLEEVLGKDFVGWIVCDGWRSYSNFTDRLQRCWAHLLREAEWLFEHCEEGKALYLALKGLFLGLKVSLLGDPPLSEREKLRVKAERRLRYWLRRRYEDAEVKRFVGKVRNGFGYWFTFVTVVGVEATNNRAERGLKECVVQRKIIGTFRNAKGTVIYETMMSLLATWKQQGLNLYQAMSENLTVAWSKNQ